MHVNKNLCVYYDQNNGSSNNNNINHVNKLLSPMIDKKAKCIILMQKCCIRFCANGTRPRQEALNNSDDEDGLEEKVSFHE